MRTPNPQWLPITMLGALMAATPAHAQNAKPAPAPAPLAGQAQPAPSRPPLSRHPRRSCRTTRSEQRAWPSGTAGLLVTVNRYQGEKRVSSLPYNLLQRQRPHDLALRWAPVPFRSAFAGATVGAMGNQRVGQDITVRRPMDDGGYREPGDHDSSIYEKVPLQ